MDQDNHLGVNEACVRKVLKGDRIALGSAFIWRHTPQGYDHWNRVYGGERELSKQDKKYLKALLPKRPKAAPETPLPDTQIAKILHHMRERGYITQRDAYIDYGIQSFTRRIADLRELGYSISTESAVHPTTKQRYSRYFLTV